jgi:nucleoside-diphosphate-sugar epimerase
VRVLITGAAGFVGSHLARRCLRAGWETAALVRPGADLWRLSDLTSLTLVEANLEPSDSLRQKLAAVSPEICIHAAWHVPPGRYLHAPENLDSVAASAALLRALAPTGCRRIVFVGSCAEYAAAASCVDETSPIGPATLYGACKQVVSIMVEHFVRQRGGTGVMARVFNPYGPQEQPSRLVPSVIAALCEDRPCPLTPGDQIRDFLHVEDAADALWTVAGGSLEGPVNISSGVPVSVAEVAGEIARLLGRPELLQLGARSRGPDDPQWLCARRGRLHEMHGWTPRYDLTRGLQHTIEWWKQNLHERRRVPTVPQQPH